jgi:hypothetical protein
MSLTGPVTVAYLPVKPITWPQDEMAAPNGFGGMSEIEFNNQNNIRQEGFVYGLTSSNVANNSIGTFSVPIAADADFWCTQILFQVSGAGAASTSPKVTITDVRTGYSLTYPYARFHNFQNLGSFNTARVPRTGRLPSTLFKPHCFTRNGGIQVTIENKSGATATYFLGFIGWKEFANVSR